MKIKRKNIIFLLMICLVSIVVMSTPSAYTGTGFTHNIPDNYYDSYSTQDILNKYNDT